MKTTRLQLCLDMLEDRRVASATVASGTLTITGSNLADTVNVSQVSNNPNPGFSIRVVETTNGITTTTNFNITAVQRITCNLYEGNNRFTNTTSLPAYVTAGSGNDTLTSGSGADTMYGGSGNDSLTGNSGNDSLDGQGGNDSINGGYGDDFLWGGTGDDTVLGNYGNDYCIGADGNDVLQGDGGYDTCIGGAGNDDLVDSTGQDSLWGSSGADNFFAAASSVQDYNPGEGDIIWASL